jgi:hypothetical protein
VLRSSLTMPARICSSTVGAPVHRRIDLLERAS